MAVTQFVYAHLFLIQCTPICFLMELDITLLQLSHVFQIDIEGEWIAWYRIRIRMCLLLSLYDIILLHYT